LDVMMTWPSSLFGAGSSDRQHVRRLAAVRANSFLSTCHCWQCPSGTRTPPYTREIPSAICLPKTVRQAVQLNFTTADGGCSVEHARGVEASVRTHLRARGASVGTVLARCVPHVKINSSDLQVRM
jgi:hypothetical protein